jgi:hypothetical protein
MPKPHRIIVEDGLLHGVWIELKKSSIRLRATDRMDGCNQHAPNADLPEIIRRATIVCGEMPPDLRTIKGWRKRGEPKIWRFYRRIAPLPKVARKISRKSSPR